MAQHHVGALEYCVTYPVEGLDYHNPPSIAGVRFMENADVQLPDDGFPDGNHS